jgi:hypothetical protein
MIFNEKVFIKTVEIMMYIIEQFKIETPIIEHPF